eukprot:TRINITY_DN83412_c0_g1_i1.p1 TRINITY_DN83412_c0_g1~~TRINITY_DN83412_c0_g1_i1.p1  ORF type:complete len:131 (+),score=17.30 TRINITY_DN83412_c0_g1_i1:94-486(+)
MLYRECQVEGVKLSGDSEKTQISNDSAKTIMCEILKHAKDGTALDLVDKDGAVTRKWEWRILPGESVDDASDPSVIFNSVYYTARIIDEDGEFVAGFRIHGGPMSWTGPWLEVRAESDEELTELRKQWSE